MHLDGALDLHITPELPSGTLVIAESLIAWLSLGLLLFGASKMFGGDGGSGAHLAASGLGRFPYLFASIISSRQLLGGAMLKSITVKPEEIVVRPEAFMSPAVIIGGVAIMGFIVWAVAILYMGYKETSRLQGGKTVASFIIGLILAEVVSKLLIVGLFRAGI